MSETVKHTHTPAGGWYFEADKGLDGHFTIWADIDGVKTFIADCYDGPEDAAIIVRAVNGFDEMQAALKAFMPWLDALDADFADESDETIVAGLGIAGTVTFGDLRRARAALLKSEG